MKKYIARIVVMLLIASVLPLQVSAAEKESIELAVEAEQVGVSLTLPQSVSGNILSLQVGLKVDSNVQEETTATFQFSENVAKVADYRYNQEKGIDLHQPNMQPLNNIQKNIVYSGSKQNVKMTMVNGKVLYYDGKFLCCDDVEALYAKANEIIKRISAQ